MSTTLYYTFETENEFCVDYPFIVFENLQDIIEYNYELRYNKPYNPINWYLDEGAKDLVKDLEKRWVKNQIDTFKYFNMDFEFKDWLHQKYESEAFAKFILDYAND